MSAKRKLESSTSADDSVKEPKMIPFSEIDRQINTELLRGDEPVEEGHASQTITDFIRKMRKEGNINPTISRDLVLLALADVLPITVLRQLIAEYLGGDTTVLMTWCDFTDETIAVSYLMFLNAGLAKKMIENCLHDKLKRRYKRKQYKIFNDDSSDHILTGVIINNSDELLFHNAEAVGEWSAEEYYTAKKIRAVARSSSDTEDDRYLLSSTSNPTVVGNIIVDNSRFTCIVLRPCITDNGAIYWFDVYIGDNLDKPSVKGRHLVLQGPGVYVCKNGEVWMFSLDNTLLVKHCA